MVRGLWDHQVYAIIDFNLGYADANTYKYEPMISLLSRWENTKKDKHSTHCHNQRNKFSPFVLLVDGMPWREALVVIYQLS